MNKGTIYRDKASKGIKCGKRVFADRWVAEINISGKRKRKRSQNLNELKAWLQLMEAESAKQKAKPRHKPKPKKKQIEIPPTFRPIIDFPKYWMDMTDGVVYRKWKKKFSMLKLGEKHDLPVVWLYSNDKRYCLSFTRLYMAVKMNISYFKIPKDILVIDDGCGNTKLISKKEQMIKCKERTKEQKKMNRMDILEEAARELEIMRRAYAEDSHVEAVQYIESRKGVLTGTLRKKTFCCQETADVCYATALEDMITRIHNPCSIILKLTTSMMSLMRTAYYRIKKEHALHLNNEVASNSYNMYNY